MRVTTRSEAREVGLKKYFTGNPCKHGHISERRAANGSCCQCVSNDKEGARRRIERFEKNNPGRIKEIRKKSRQKRAEYVLKYSNQYMKRRRKSDPEFRMRQFMRDCVHRVMRQKNRQKAEDLIGYSRADLVAHLESKFQPGMSWENYGTEWQIDHACPISFFLSIEEDDPSVINALDNLQPLWTHENKKKGGWPKVAS